MARLGIGWWETRQASHLDDGRLTADTSIFNGGDTSAKGDSGASNIERTIRMLPTASKGLSADGTLTAYLRCYYYLPAYPAVNAGLMRGPTANVDLFVPAEWAGVWVTTSGKLRAVAYQAGGTVRAQSGDSSDTIPLNTWVRVEAKVRAVRSGNFATLIVDEVRLNGVAQGISVSFTVDISALSGDNNPQIFPAMGWTSPPGANKVVYIDDAGWNDDVGASHNSWLGPGLIKACIPSAPGNSAQWTRGGTTQSPNENWNYVEERPADDDGTYVVTGTNGAVDEYALLDLPAEAESVTLVAVAFRVRGEGTTARTIEVGIRDGAATEVESYNATHTAYRTVPSHDFAVGGTLRMERPGGQGAWTVAAINNLQGRLRYAQSQNRPVRVSHLIILVEYVPVLETPVSRTMESAYEAGQGARRAADAPQEAQGIASAQRQPAFEGLAARAAVAAPAQEALGGARGDGAAALESLAGARASTSSPLEAQGVVGAALQPPFEAQVGVAQTRIPNIEAMATARADGTTVLESLFGLQPAAAVVHEASGAVQTSAAVPKESLVALRRERFAIWEALADSRNSVASGLETLGSLLAAGTVQQEAQGYVTGPRAAVFEALTGARAQALTPWESLADLRAGAVTPLEALRSLAAAASPPVEATGLVASLRTALHEALGGARATSGPLWEALVGLSNGASTPMEALEATGFVASLQTVLYEALGGARVTSGPPWEALAGVRVQTLSPGEALTGLHAQAGPLHEALLLLLSERAVPFEAEGAVGAVSNALMVPYEASGIVASQGVAPVEALVLVLADRAPAMEILQRVRADGLAQLEWLRGVRIAIAVPVEAGGTAVPTTVLIARFALPRRCIGGLPGYPPGRLPGRDL